MRILTSAIILLAVLMLPYWLYLPMLLFAIIAFPFYFEAVLLGLLIDMLYGVHESGILAFPFGIAMTILVMIAMPTRTYIRFHA